MVAFLLGQGVDDVGMLGCFSLGGLGVVGCGESGEGVNSRFPVNQHSNGRAYVSIVFCHEE